MQLAQSRSGITAAMLRAPERYRFDRALRALLWLGLGVHALLLPIFFFFGLDALVVFGVASFSVWGASLWLSYRRASAAFVLASVGLAPTIMLTLHQIGWHSGFQYLLLVTAIMASRNPYWPMRGRMAAIALVAITFLILAALFRGEAVRGGVAAAAALQAWVVHGLYLTNMVVVFAAFGLMMASYGAAAEAVDQAFRRLVNTDPLTKLENRRSMTAKLEAAIEQGKRRTDHPVSLILCDVDYFKRINDTWGHEWGDRALRHIAQVLRESVRDGDAIARWGGEEFLVLLADANREAAAAVVGRIRSALAASALTADGEQIPLNLTFGLTEHRRDESWQDVLRRADEALITGKRSGRDQAVFG
jgi:diguanylate cyclase (GGDEF)-like protein